MGGYAWSTWKLILRLESLTWILFFGGPELLSALCSLPSALCCWGARGAWELILVIKKFAWKLFFGG